MRSSPGWDLEPQTAAVLEALTAAPDTLPALDGTRAPRLRSRLGRPVRLPRKEHRNTREVVKRRFTLR